MQPTDSRTRGATRWKVIVFTFVVVCLVNDFFPRHGPPDFRYTGADPKFAVWNLGTPFVLFIYDPRNGVHVGPLGYVVLAFQMLLLAVGCFVIGAVRHPCHQTFQSTDPAERSA